MPSISVIGSKDYGVQAARHCLLKDILQDLVTVYNPFLVDGKYPKLWRRSDLILLTKRED